MDHKKSTEKMATALVEFQCRRLGKHFMESSNCNDIPLCKVLYFVRCTGLLAEWSRWWRTVDKKMVAVHGSPCAPTPLILILRLLEVWEGSKLKSFWQLYFWSISDQEIYGKRSNRSSQYFFRNCSSQNKVVKTDRHYLSVVHSRYALCTNK
jgi:hypothetical protein